MRKLLVLFALTFAIFACSNDCLNVANECLNGRYSEKKDNENNQSNDNNSNKEEPGKRFTTLQEVVDKTNAGEEIDLSDYELIDYNATIDKKITIKNGSLSNAKLTVTSENVKLESLTDLSVLASSRLTISESKLSSLLIGGNSETSRSRASEPQMSLAMVSLTDSEIAEVQLNGFNSQLNITDTDTKIDDIVTSTKSKIILEAGKYEGMKDPVVTDNGELTRIDMTKDKTLSILSIYSNPNKAEYKLNEEIDLTGLIVMGTYTASVEIFKSGGWKGEAIESVTKWEDEKDYDVDYDFSKTGVRIVTIKSTINPDVACNFYVYVVDDSQNGETSKPEKIEFTNIRVESLLQTPKTSYKVGEKLDLSGYRVMGTYNGLDVNLQYTSDPANGTVLSEGGEITVTFYYNGTSVAINNPIKISVAQPYIVTFKVGNDVYCTTEMAHGESLKLPSDPNRENYTFAGWYIGDKKVTSGSSVESNLELIAKWEAIECCLILKVDGKQTIKVGKYNDKVNILNPELKDGYTFAGWNPPLPEIYSTETTTHEAQWTANKYTVKFNANGGSGTMTVQTFTYDIEQELTVNAFTLDGFTFAGWSIHEGSSAVEYEDKESVINLTEENNGTITLYAQWIEKGAYKITYELDSGANNTKNPNAYKDSSGKIDLYNPTKTGYNFEGWYTDKDFAVKISAISEDSTGDITLYAKWKIETYTITYNNCDGATNANNPASYNVESGTITLAEATKTGYTFVGWYTDEACTEANKVTEIAKGYTGNLTLYAQWEANKYTVQFNANGGSGTMDDQTFAYDEQKALTANSFARTGYTFAGWATTANGEKKYTDRQEVSNLTTENGGEVTLYAQWTAKTDTAYKVEHYQQNIDDDEYTLVEADTENKTGTTGEETSALAKTYEGFTAKTVEQVKITADGKAVVKIYYDRNIITLTLNLDGGEGENEITGKYGADVTAPATPTKSGYKFTGWNPELPETFPAENVTYTATWAEAEANAYYVSSSSGSDDNSGTSTAQPFKTVQKAVNEAITSNDEETTYKIYVMDDITGGDSSFDATTNYALINIVPTKKLNLKISGYNNTVSKINANRTYSYSGNKGGTIGRVMYIGANADVRLENITLTGGAINNSSSSVALDRYGGGAYVFGGSLTMSANAKISNCVAAVGGAVYLANDTNGTRGVFTMFGGSIQDCKVDSFSTKYGGGVYMENGTFNMSGGTISWSGDDYCAERGGGVYMKDGTFAMSGSAKIEGCKTYWYGGGVYVNAGTFTMSGGTINMCKAYNNNKTNEDSCGGGVYVNAGTFTMSGGTISNCEVYNSYSAKFAYGGGVYLASRTTFNMSGGTIGNCKVSNSSSGTSAYGGGVYLAGYTLFDMSDGTISACEANYGGGVSMGGSYCAFMMSGSAEINTCRASKQGGGVYQGFGEFEMSGGTIGGAKQTINGIEKTFGCTAEQGGGVYLDAGSFTMSDGSITENSATSSSQAALGGGVYVTTTFNMNGGGYFRKQSVIFL